MKKSIKNNILLFIIGCSIVFSFPICVCAEAVAEMDKISQYQYVIDKINAEYGTEIRILADDEVDCLKAMGQMPDISDESNNEDVDIEKFENDLRSSVVLMFEINEEVAKLTIGAQLKEA